MELIGQVVKKFRDGDHISDKELSFGITKLEEMCNDLASLGERYQLTWRSLYDIKTSLDGIKQSRERR